MPANHRIFTRKKLSELGKNFMELALEALDKNDVEKARYWCQRQEATKLYIHDIYLMWTVKLLSLICDRLGEDAVAELMPESVKPWCEPFYETKNRMLRDGGVAAYVEHLADVWRQHCGKFTVDEDDEKIIFRHEPCGSGGRLVDMKAYDGESGFRKLKEAGPHTFGEQDMPVYCSHCPWVHQILPVRLHGAGAQLWVHASPFPKKPGDACVHYIYKDPKSIPEQYYEMVGMAKPPH